MSDTNIIKTIVPTECPGCHKTLLVSFQMTAPVLTSVFTPEQLQEAKRDAIGRVKALSIDPGKISEVVAWIDNEETIFDPSEVEGIIQSLLK